MTADTTTLSSAFDAAVSYEDYLASVPDKEDAFRSVEERIRLSDASQTMLQSWTRQMRVLVISGAWCGDCVRQVPILATIAAACPCIDLRLIDRDHPKSPIDHFQINRGRRVPCVLFMAEDSAFVSVFGDKTVSYYRWAASQQLGPSCPLPGAPTPETLLASITGDWLSECERVQLLLRLSPRLRSVHGD